jgi:chitinase
MRSFLLFLLLTTACQASGWSQYRESEARSWDRFPPEAQMRGFGVNKSQLVQMDKDGQLEEVFLFSADNGHYPYFDVFKVYYLVVGYYSKEVKYKSDVLLTTERNLLLEDRDNDGCFELYRRYMKDGKFTVDESGNNLSASWTYDRVEWNGKSIK